MNASVSAKEATGARSIESLASELRELERQHEQVQREHKTARNLRPQLKAQGDTEALARCQETISRTAAKLDDLADEMKDCRAAIEFAQKRDQGYANQEALDRIEKQMAVVMRSAKALDDATKAYGAALLGHRLAVEEADAVLRRNGLSVDRYLSLEAKVVGIASIALYVATNHVMGKPLTIETDHQIEQNGRASQALAAKEYVTLTLRRAQAALCPLPGRH